MVKRKPRFYWNKDTLKLEALKYKYRVDFKRGSYGAYCASLKLGVMSDICSHMKPKANSNRRALYVFEFQDNSAYIGLTWNYKNRLQSHLKRGPVFEKVKEGISYKFIKLEIFYDKSECGEREDALIEKYKKEGWLIINKNKGGALGGGKTKWTIEVLAKEAKKYKSRSEFYTNSKGAYNKACKLKIMSEIGGHFKPTNTHNEKTVTREARKYKTRTSFAKGNQTAYNKARKLNILDKVCKHMTRRLPNEQK